MLSRRRLSNSMHAKRLDSNGVVEFGLLFTVATSGYVPVICNLVCITRFGRSSWNFFPLALCCFTLSTATLCFSQWFWQQWVPEITKNDVLRGLDLAFSVDDLSELGYAGAFTTYACGITPPAAILESWCGSSPPILSGLSLSIITSGWNWVLWAICLMRCYEMARASY